MTTQKTQHLRTQSAKTTRKQYANISQALSLATLAVMGQQAMAENVNDAENPWEVDAAVLYYAEQDGRIHAAEPVISAKKDFGDERIFSGKLVVDSLTGASPNGAAPASVPQTFTNASGRGKDAKQYVIPAGQLPLDGEFKDTRVAVSGAWSQPISAQNKMSVGGNISSEYDFKSLGANASISHDLNQKNTTLNAGIAIEHDIIQPVGGAPTPLSVMSSTQKQEGDETKQVYDLLLGVTQVLNRNAVAQVNYGFSSSTGYMNDPYKIVSLLNADQTLNGYAYESRPDTRQKHSLYTQLKYNTPIGILDTSYRYTTDDWGVDSHTLDAKLRVNVGESPYFVEPHVRYYTQTAADFYHAYMVSGADFSSATNSVKPGALSALIAIPPISSATNGIKPIAGYASADYRLAEFDATTVGLKVGRKLANDGEISLRVEQYAQTPHVDNPLTAGELKGQTLGHDLNALMVQVGYRFKW